MQIFDIIVLAALGIAAIFGLIKGFWSQLFGFLGLLVITVGTAYLYKFPLEWMAGLITNKLALQIVALLITAVVLGIVFSIITRQLKKLLTAIKFMKVLDRVLGMVLSMIIVYGIFAIFIAWLNNTTGNIPEMIKNAFGEQWGKSWVINKLYAKNFFGDWLLQLIAKQFGTVIPNA